MSQAYTAEDHLSHAQHNEKFLDYMLREILPTNQEFADWAMVVAFYSALHYTKWALLRDRNLSVARHRSYSDTAGWHPGHNDLVREHLTVVRTRYRELFDMGHEARYRGFYRMPGNALAEVKRKRRALEDIKLACQPLEDDAR